MPQEFVPLAERIIDAMLATQPDAATFAGDHRHDDRLPDLSADGVDREIAMLRDASQALVGIDPEDLSISDGVDHAILGAMVDRRLFELNDLREWEWNPMAHNPGDALFELIARPFAPVDTRLESLAGRLEAIPDALATARTVLTGCPRIHLETAAAQFAGTAGLVRTEVPRMLDVAPALRGRVEPAVAGAVRALDGFAAWLSDRAADPEDGRDPRLGRRLWEARLWHTLDTDLPARDLLDRAYDHLDRVTAELRAAAAELVGGPADDDAVARATERLAADRPDNATVLDSARRAMEQATGFVAEHDLVGLVDDPCVVEEMPEFARGVAVAVCNPTGPLETADVPTFFHISPAPAAWSPEQVTSYYCEFNNSMIRGLAVHEAMPGHFLQLAHARRYRGSTRTRSLAWSPTFVEGWAVYAEQVMAGLGFGGLPVRIAQLKGQLRSAANAILDQAAHCDGMTAEEAVEFMVSRGHQERNTARLKWRRALLTSTQLSTYLVGYLEMSAIAAERPPDATLRAWHDAMLRYGAPPPRHLRTLLAADRPAPAGT